MKILIVSDTHGYNEKLWDIIENEEPIDMVIHCGDLECDESVIRDGVDCTLIMVPGNNDYYSELERVRTIDIGKYKAVITHGHRYHVHSGFDALYYLGIENHADFVIFGHTHVPVVRTEGPITYINPGSLTYPRQAGSQSTYIIMTVVDNEQPTFEIKYC